MSPASAPAKRDLRQEVTDAIIAALEKGVAPPWQPGAFEMPLNPTSGKSYHGGNAVHLMVVGMRCRWHAGGSNSGLCAARASMSPIRRQ